MDPHVVKNLDTIFDSLEQLQLSLEYPQGIPKSEEIQVPHIK